MGTNNSKKCTVFLSFSGDAGDCSSTCISWLYWQLQRLSSPRAKNIWRSSAVSSELQVRSFPARPVRSWRHRTTLEKWLFSGSLGD